ncbi:MAG TPA: hypothetical protein VFW40_03990, partial [Capsulimonadaceae bacterium]|nr:hypothetical protein [Capsulimonadaceae bacterium]
ELLRCSGTQFDEYVVMSFLRILDEEKRNVPAAAEEGDLQLTLVSNDECGQAKTQGAEDAAIPGQREAKKSASRTSSQAV